jgi:uncharacterized RDD family membrane protein YckC
LNAPIDTCITAETPEGIAIAIRPAGFAVRATAFLTDAVIRTSALSVLVTTLSVGGHFGGGPILIASFVANWLYPVIFELLPGAATPGKRIFGLQVMMANGLPITPAACLIRNLMRVVDFLPFMYAFGIICILMRRDARRLGDLAGGTLVHYRQEVAVAGAFGHATPMPSPVTLSARQQAAIAAFAWRAPRLTPERAEEIAHLALGLAPAGMATAPMTERLVGIARWLHGQRRREVAAIKSPV